MKARRETINDNLIDDELYFKILTKTMTELKGNEITQKGLINILLPLKLSNKTIARVVNDLIPEARATEGSIAVQLRQFKKQKNLLEELKLQVQEGL